MGPVSGSFGASLAGRPVYRRPPQEQEAAEGQCMENPRPFACSPMPPVGSVRVAHLCQDGPVAEPAARGRQ